MPLFNHDVFLLVLPIYSVAVFTILSSAGSFLGNWKLTYLIFIFINLFIYFNYQLGTKLAKHWNSYWAEVSIQMYKTVKKEIHLCIWRYTTATRWLCAFWRSMRPVTSIYRCLFFSNAYRRSESRISKMRGIVVTILFIFERFMTFKQCSNIQILDSCNIFLHFITLLLGLPFIFYTTTPQAFVQL